MPIKKIFLLKTKRFKLISHCSKFWYIITVEIFIDRGHLEVARVDLDKLDLDVVSPLGEALIGSHCIY